MICSKNTAQNEHIPFLFIWQLIWILALDEIGELHHIKLPGLDDPASDPKQAILIQTWRELNQFEETKFQMPCRLNGLVAHHMIFSISHWQKEDQKRLQNMEMIQSIEKNPQKCL